jgi:Conserved TM helix
MSEILRPVALVVPKLVLFAAILAAGWLVGRLLLRIADRTLERIGFNRVAERGGVQRMLGPADATASGVVARLAYGAVLLFTLQLAFGIWGPNPVSALIASVVAWLPKAVVAIAIVVVTAAIARVVRDVVGTALGGLSYGRLVAAIASYFILGLGTVAALNQVGVATTITTPVLVTVLATAGGIAVVGLGGGLVKPMQQRWERWLSRAEEESHAIGQHARAYAAGTRDTRYASIYVSAAAQADTTQETPAPTLVPSGAPTAPPSPAETTR